MRVPLPPLAVVRCAGGDRAAMHLIAKCRGSATARWRRSLGSARAQAMTSAASSGVAVRRLVVVQTARVAV
jgi:hypothetical protein